MNGNYYKAIEIKTPKIILKSGKKGVKQGLSLSYCSCVQKLVECLLWV